MKKQTKSNQATPLSNLHISNGAKERFADARDKVVLGDTLKLGIGCLGEKTVHAVLKLYLEPDTSFHEQNVTGRYVADIKNEAGIFEVQTAAFSKMAKKLEAFLSLEDTAVTVVYPCIYNKWVIWAESDGSLSKPNRSPKRGSVYNVFYELYNIRHLLKNPNLRVLVIMLDANEYKLLDGYGKNKKSRATKFDRIPTDIVGEYLFSCPEDYSSLLPDALPKNFSVPELANALKLDRTKAYGIIAVLEALDKVKFVGKEGRSRKYERC